MDDNLLFDCGPSFDHKKYLREDRTLSDSEAWWRDRQVWLESKGYMLRPRYRPGWVPSWDIDGKSYLDHEDFWGVMCAHRVMDATRMSDNKLVMLKKVTDRHPYEVEITQFFSTGPLADEPRNHCVPLLDVVMVPDTSDSILVLPYLVHIDHWPFKTVGEVIDCFTQLFEGLSLMHEHHVAHRDCMWSNIMMDPEPLCPGLFHPAFPARSRDFKSWNVPHYNRTSHPTKYYLIDFGISRRYSPNDPSPKDYIILGGDKTVPELQNGGDLKPRNPFPIDIYYLGNMMRQHFLQELAGLDFLTPLVEDMTQTDPTKRPTIREVIARFSEICKALPPRQLRMQVFKVKEPPSLFSALSHAWMTMRLRIAGQPAIPRLSVRH